MSYDGIFKDAYQVSNWGRVRSVDRWVKHSRGRKILKRGRILIPGVCGKGYLIVTLCVNGCERYPNIHRLVWEAFVGEIPKGLQINHKDEVKSNNHLNNLEICTSKYNNNYGTKKERCSNALMNRSDCSKPVMQYTKDGQFIAEYPSQTEAFRQTGISRSNISACCLGKARKNGSIFKSAGGFVWKFDNR